MSAERNDSIGTDFSISQEEWERRVLCSDGNCIGVIGPDGRCKECGKPHEGQAPGQAGEDSSDSRQSGEEKETAATTGEADSAAPPTHADDRATVDDWERRVLCSDGNCIGVIGADGRCKECGKPYEGH